MDIKQIYSAWKTSGQLPTSDHIVYFTLTEKTRELKMTTLLLKALNNTVNIIVTSELAKKIPHMWDNICLPISTASPYEPSDNNKN